MSEPPPKPNTELVSVQSDYFEIFAQDAASAQFVETLSAEVVREIGEIVPVPAANNTPVVVFLVAPGDWNGANQFTTRLGDSGEVITSIRWANDIQRDTVIRALVQALASRIIYRNFGRERVARFPLWAELGLLERVLVRLNATRRDYLALEARDAGPGDVVTLFTLQRDDPEPPNLRTHAFWLMEALEVEAGTRAKVREWMLRLWTADSPGIVLVRIAPDIFRDQLAIRLWYAASYFKQVSVRTSPILSLSESEQFLTEVTRFRARFDGRDVLLQIDELWAGYGEQALMDTVTARLAVIRQSLAAINPVYYNATLKLGQALEAFAAGDSDGFNTLASEYQRVLRATDATANAIRSVVEADVR